MKRALVASLAAATLLMGTGCATVYRFIGDMTAQLITQKTADLSQLSVNAGYITNLFPTTFELTETDYGAEYWREGQNLLGVNLFKRSGVGLYELDGAVGYRDAKGALIPMTYVGKGSYMVPLAKNDYAPKTIVLRSANGQTATFRVAPAPPITIKAINGKPPQDATIDLSRDMVLDVAHAPGSLGTPVKISMIATALGQRAMTDIGIFKAANRMVIPKAAFRNLSITASQDVGAVTLERGRSLLLLERYDQQVTADGRVEAAQLIGKAWSWAPVKVVGDWRPNTAIDFSGEMSAQASPVRYSVFKPSAYYAPALLGGKTFSLGALRARGTLYKSTKSESSSEAFGVRTTTTTTTTLQFPDLPDATWQGMLAQLERGLGDRLKRATGVQLVPMERLAASPTYKKMGAMEQVKANRAGIDKSEVYVEKPLRGSRFVFPESFADVLSSVSSTFPADRPISRVLAESRMDGLMVGTLDLQIATQKGSDKLVLVPRFSYSFYGPPNGYVAGPTSFGGGTIEMRDGVPFSEAELRKNPRALDAVVRMNDLLDAFEKSLRELRMKEMAEGYDAIWLRR